MPIYAHQGKTAVEDFISDYTAVFLDTDFRV
jgi:hypothetical protein